jgi:two-component system sensor histidine kinase RpfC
MKPVLLLSPDPGQRQELAGYLAQWDWSPDECANSVQAFAALMRAAADGRCYRRILVDGRGLDMSPLQFIASLQVEPTLKGLQLALITSPMPELERRQLAAAGYLGIVETPLDKSLLFRALSAESGPAPKADNLLPLSAHQRRQRQRIPTREVLLAETCEPTRQNLTRILSKAGYNVCAVRDGEHALDVLERQRIDVAILAWEMPSISGADVARIYSFTHTSAPQTEFLFITSKRGAGLSLLRREIDPKSVLTKPVQAESLLKAIEATLESQPAADTGARDALRLVERITLDRKVLDSLNRLAPAPDFVEQLIQEFIRDGSQWITRLQQAAQGLDYAGFQAAAHALVDNAGHLGASSLHHCAGKAMRLSRNGFPGQAIALAKDTTDSFKATRRALIEYLQRHTGASRS